ncbi:MAG: ATP-binding cassette domain-containing protein [Desulfobacterales bacterium]|nr:ATP-binding cassette domain-containing protein [Desulfobacterales bacterium]
MRLAGTNITFHYPGAESAVFKDFSFQLAEPGFHAIFGPSGVGKTSLARMITGDLSPTAGKIAREGIDTVLYCYNLERLPGWSSVGRHLDRVTPEKNVGRKEELVSVFGLQECMGSKFLSLSLGQRNRVNLLRYLLQDFQVLVMDESLANVDEKTRETILLKIKELYPEELFLYISHNVVEVSKFCRQIVVVRDSDKKPQGLTIRGVDHRNDREFPNGRLEQVMLEIMNAA